jgi:hypothetical protein
MRPAIVATVTTTGDDTAEIPIGRLDRRRDLRGWLAPPLVTLVLAPALAISVGILVAESSTGYPAICDASAASNGCQETIFGLFALHARIFLLGWLLLWALPWWRGLRPYRIAGSVAVGAILLAAPLRLVSGVSLQGMFRMGDWDQYIRDPARTADEVSHLATAFAVTALLLLLVPVAAGVWFAVRHRRGAAAVCAVLALLMLGPGYQLARLNYHASDRARQLHVVPEPDPPCQVHSGSKDVCPGG